MSVVCLAMCLNFGGRKICRIHSSIAVSSFFILDALVELHSDLIFY